MALLTPVSLPGSAGTTITWTAAAGGGDTIAYRKDKKQVLLVKNDSGSNRTITVTAVRTSAQSGRDVAVLTDLAVITGSGVIKAYPLTAAYVASTGLISVSYNAVTSMSVALIEL